MMPDDGLDQLRDSDSVFLGAVGWPGVPDHVSLWGLLIPIRRSFDQYVNLRPCGCCPASAPRSRTAGRRRSTSTWCARTPRASIQLEIGGRMFGGTEREFAVQQSTFTRTASTAC
jgi:tartrate dehydrogenase/decarboxylase / D-malate dehydrogenase